MRIAAEYTFEDYVAAQRAHARQYRGRVILFYGGGLLLLVAVIFAKSERPQPGFFVPLAIFLTILVLRPFLNRLWWKRLWRQSPDAGAHIEAEFGEHGISVSTAGQRGSFDWPVCSHYREAPDVF